MRGFKLSIWTGLFFGLGTYALLLLMLITLKISNIELLTSFLPPIVAGMFSDDDSWFWSGFLTIFISGIVLGYFSAYLLSVDLFFTWEYPALWIFGILVLPILTVLAAVIGGVLGLLGRIIGENLGLR